jgi:hypothetical protein
VWSSIGTISPISDFEVKMYATFASVVAVAASFVTARSAGIATIRLGCQNSARCHPLAQIALCVLRAALSDVEILCPFTVFVLHNDVVIAVCATGVAATLPVVVLHSLNPSISSSDNGAVVETNHIHGPSMVGGVLSHVDASSIFERKPILAGRLGLWRCTSLPLDEEVLGFGRQILLWHLRKPIFVVVSAWHGNLPASVDSSR